MTSYLPCPSPSPHADYYNMQNAGPTLAQLNSPPNEDLMTLKTFGDLDSLNLDLEALTGDLLSGYPVEVRHREWTLTPNHPGEDGVRAGDHSSPSPPLPALRPGSSLHLGAHLRNLPLRLPRAVKLVKRRAASQS